MKRKVALRWAPAAILSVACSATVAAEEPAAFDLQLDSEFGGLLMLLAMVLSYALVARRPAHGGKPAPGASAKQPPRKATVHQMPSRGDAGPTPAPDATPASEPLSAGKG